MSLIAGGATEGRVVGPATGNLRIVRRAKIADPVTLGPV